MLNQKWQIALKLIWLKPKCFGTNDVLRAFCTEDIAFCKLAFEILNIVSMVLFGTPDFIFRKIITPDVLMLRVDVLRMVCDAYWQRTSKYIRLSPVKFWLFASDISLSLSNVNFGLETDAKISFSSVTRSIIPFPTIAIDPKVWVSRSPTSILPSWTRFGQHLAPWSSRMCLFTKQLRLTSEDTLVRGVYKGSTMHVFLLF